MQLARCSAGCNLQGEERSGRFEAEHVPDVVSQGTDKVTCEYFILGEGGTTRELTLHILIPGKAAAAATAYSAACIDLQQEDQLYVSCGGDVCCAHAFEKHTGSTARDCHPST